MHVKKFQLILAFEILLDIWMHTKLLSENSKQQDIHLVSATDIMTSLELAIQGNVRMNQEYITKADEKVEN